ncbi:hypothetical protein AAG570_012200 [Ranatra chinensis]|uniref:Sulfhydryl oxidase n=1 Tax=Ranatra chinensis TaxID=642074 RepID=A0ABD0YIH2_9HEMI
MHLPNIQTRIALSTNKNLILSLRNVIGSYDELVSPFVLVIDRNISITPINISLKNNDWRLSVYNAVKEFFMSLGILAKELKPHDIIDDEVPDISEIMQLMQIEDQIKKKLHLNQLSDVVFQLDLEGGLKYTLFHEIPSHKVISGNSMVALKSYVNVLNKYFPFRKEGMKFISKVYEEIYKKDDIGGSDFEALVSHYEKKYHSVFLYPQGWLGCRGSQPHYRGFPCSLWLIFHTLTVQAELHKNKYHDSDPKEVLHAMLGYVKHFFGCTDCSQHFQQMADSIDQDVHSLEGSILWLWKAHNKVNRRLQKDKTEDPKHPKVQFPTPSTCSNCSINGEFNDKNVLNFLRAMFHNISYLHLAANGESVIYNKLLYNRISNDDLQYVAKEETKSTQFTFNILDVSLCVVLYLFSIGIIILVCIKFFIKKGYRRKVYVYDLFHKV